MKSERMRGARWNEREAWDFSVCYHFPMVYFLIGISLFPRSIICFKKEKLPNRVVGEHVTSI